MSSGQERNGAVDAGQATLSGAIFGSFWKLPKQRSPEPLCRHISSSPISQKTWWWKIFQKMNWVGNWESGWCAECLCYWLT